MNSQQYKAYQERISTVIFYRDLQKQKRELIAFLRLYDQKWFVDDFNNFIDKILVRLPFIVSRKAKQTLTVWYNSWKDTFKSKTEWFAINWGLKNDEASIYIARLTDLHLSQNKWSISRTTKLWIIDLLQEWIDEWLSYWEIANQINKKDPFIFSKSRSELIAKTEIWRAYEKGNEIPMRQLKNKWEYVLKKWISAEDFKVRPTHTQNASDWYIELDIPFSWTHSHIAPEWFWCRCSTAYLIE